MPITIENINEGVRLMQYKRRYLRLLQPASLLITICLKGVQLKSTADNNRLLTRLLQNVSILTVLLHTI